MTQVTMVKVNKKAKKVYKQEVFQRGLLGMLAVVALAGGMVTGGYFFPAARNASSLEPSVPAVVADQMTEAANAASDAFGSTVALASTDPAPAVAVQAPVEDPAVEPATLAGEVEPVTANGGLAPAALLPADISLIVLNGSGMDGAAGQFAEYAATKGFVNIETANAKRWDYTETEIYFSEANAEKAKLVMELLGKKYSWIMYAEALDDRDADVVIVVGETSPLQEL